MILYDNFLSFMKLTPQEPTLAFLCELYQAFTKIPYENATKIINKNRSTNRFRMPEELLEDFVKLGAGGTCFSLVYTLNALLKNLKFDSHIMLADRTYGENTHASVIVYLNNQKILLDPGYLVPTPVFLPQEGEQISHAMPMSNLVIETVLGNFKVSTQRNNNLTFRYLIKSEPVPEKEFVQIWESSFEHKMMDNLFMTKLTSNSQIYVRENRVEIITKEDRKKYFLSDNFSTEVSKIFGISQKVLEELKKCHSLKS